MKKIIVGIIIILAIFVAFAAFFAVFVADFAAFTSFPLISTTLAFAFVHIPEHTHPV